MRVILWPLIWDYIYWSWVHALTCENLFGLRAILAFWSFISSFLWVLWISSESWCLTRPHEQARTPGNDRRRMVFNLTCFTLWMCSEHNGSMLCDKCYSQSDLSAHNAPLLDSLSRGACVNCSLGSDQVSHLMENISIQPVDHSTQLNRCLSKNTCKWG